MPIQFSCSQCQKQMKAPDGTEGKKARCPACSAITLIPVAAAAAASVPVAQVANPAPPRMMDSTPPVSDNPFAAPSTTDFSGSLSAQDHRSRSGKPSWDASPSLANFFKTSVEVVTQPTDTFRNLTPDGGLGRPMTYAAIVGALMGLCGGLLAVLFLTLGPAVGGAGGPEAAMLVGVGLGALIFAPILYGVMMPIGCLIGAGFMHVMLMIVGAKKYDYSATARCFTYAYLGGWPVMLVSAIPFIGILVAIPWTIWMLIIYVIGFSEVHETTKGKVILAFVVPFVVLLVLGIALAVIGNVA